MKVSVVKETAPGERRVALVPEAVGKLRAAGLEVLVESGAGEGAWLTDDGYAEAGATVVSRADALGGRRRADDRQARRGHDRRAAPRPGPDRDAGPAGRPRPRRAGSPPPA